VFDGQIGMTYHELRDRFATALEGAALSHERGVPSGIETGYDELDVLLPRGQGPEYDKLHVALHFWDGWIDARNHDWMYYEGIEERDWPHLARVIATDLRADREIQDERVLIRFELRSVSAGPSLWSRIMARLRGEGAVEQ
jgi:hypothetical protein